MAEQAMDEGLADAGGGRKRGGKRLIIFTVLALLLMVGTAAGLYFSGIASTLLGKGEEKTEQKVEAPPPPPKVPVFYDDLPDMLVNLNTGSRKSSFLKLHVSLQIESEEDKAKIKLVQARVIDTFQTYLREL